MPIDLVAAHKTDDSADTWRSAVEVNPRCPKLRKDLMIFEQAQSGKSCYVVKDPVSLRYFKIAEDEYFLLKMFDGNNSLEQIVDTYYRSFGLKSNVETLERFVKKIEEAKFLDLEQGKQYQPWSLNILGSDGERRVSFFQKLLFIKVKAFNPDKLFNSLIKQIGFFFNAYFIFLASATMLSALAITIVDWLEISSQLRDLFALRYVLPFWVAALVIAVLHEFAHGLTCKHYGGEVREVGLLLLYFHPALYCNVSDAWSFKEKHKRLWVMFAGGFFETFVWGVAVLAWWVLPPGAFLSRMCLVVMAISGAKIIFNFNPLIKLDGYYLLSDYLEIPNLRRKAFEYVKQAIKSKIYGPQSTTKSIPRKEKIIYAIYSLLAVPYMIFLIGLMYWNLAYFLISKYKGTGIFILAGITIVVFGDKLMTGAIRAYDRRLRQSPQQV